MKWPGIFAPRPKSHRRLDFNGILQHIGPVGWWQIRTLLSLCLVSASSGVAVVAFAFTAFVPNYRCLVPQCEHSAQTAQYYLAADHKRHHEFVRLGLGALQQGLIGGSTLEDVGKTCHRPSLGQLDIHSTCDDFMLKLNDTTNFSSTACAYDELVYDRSVVESSIVEDFQFVCDRYHWRSFFNALYMGGMLIGSFIIGLFSDRYGRMNALTLSIVLVATAGSLTPIAYYQAVMGVLRLLTGIGGMGCYIVSYVLVAESTLPAYTVRLATAIGAGFVSGELILATEAYFFRQWKHLQWVAYGPMFALLLIRIWVPESTRWLISQGRIREATRQIQSAAALNGKSVPDHLLEGTAAKDTAGAARPSADSGSKASKEEPAAPAAAQISFMDLFRPLPILKRTLNMFVQWFSVTMVYYGLTFASTSLAADPYLSFALATLGDLLSFPFCLLVTNRWGRKPMLMTMQSLAGVCCLVSGLLQNVIPFVEHSTTHVSLQALQIFLSVAGKFSTSCAFSLVYLYTSELYPTGIRNTSVGSCSAIARVGGIISLLMASLSQVWKPLPMVIMGSIAIASGVLTLFLPETTGQPLPETMEDAVRLEERSLKRGFCGLQTSKAQEHAISA